MPYERFLELAQKTQYDIDRLASAFSVSFEQACQRLTTLQRESARGVPFFFLRVDKAGNVTKRFNATSFNIAEHGGPVLSGTFTTRSDAGRDPAAVRGTAGWRAVLHP